MFTSRHILRATPLQASRKELATVICPLPSNPCQQGVCGGAGLLLDGAGLLLGDAGLLLGGAGHLLGGAGHLPGSAVLLLGGAGHLPIDVAGSRHGARGLPGLARGQPDGDHHLLHSYIHLLAPLTLKKQQSHGTH
jgi:hypothetical protein